MMIEQLPLGTPPMLAPYVKSSHSYLPFAGRRSRCDHSNGGGDRGHDE